MPYEAEISRVNPTCFLFLIDQSGSMEDLFESGEAKVTKAKGVADAMNRLLQNLVIRCAKPDLRDYYHISVIGYGATVGTCLGGQLGGKELVPISEIAEAPAMVDERTRKVSDGAGGLVEETFKLPVWLNPVADDGTPMCQALSLGRTILQKWLSEHPTCFPPIVIHMTDGESTDGDPTEALSSITSLQSQDGNVLLFNVHLSSISEKPIAFPSNEEGLPDKYALMLFRTASPLIPSMIEYAKRHHDDLNIETGARGFVYNADLVLVVQALEIGTIEGPDQKDSAQR